VNVKTLEVCVAPVAVQPDPPAQLRVMVYRPQGQWLHAALGSMDSPAEAALELIWQVPHLQALAGDWAPTLEPAGFVQSDAAIRLVFTAALPSTVTMVGPLDAAGVDWHSLAPWLGDPKGHVSV
jgi:hypothetical protein